MPKIGECEECGTTDVLGFLACHLKYLCPKCAAETLGAPEEKVRESLLRKLNENRSLQDKQDKQQSPA